MKRIIETLILVTLFTNPAVAEVAYKGAASFTSSHVRTVQAAPDEVYRVMTQEISQWWDEAHSWSGDGNNLYLEARPGGCFCEKLPNGGWVEHLRIVYLSPEQEIRLQGGLGPLQTMGLQGTMTWTIAPVEGGSTVQFTYIVHGHLAEGFDSIATAVDGVIGEQLEGLAMRLASD